MNFRPGLTLLHGEREASPAGFGSRQVSAIATSARSKESHTINDSIVAAIDHYLAAPSRLWDDPEQRFHRLLRVWKNDVKILSDTNEICTHPAYQQIIGMGQEALPFIIAELEREPDEWFWALKAITGDDPVPEEHRGRVRLMAQDWLEWAKQNLSQNWLRPVAFIEPLNHYYFLHTGQRVVVTQFDSEENE